MNSIHLEKPPEKYISFLHSHEMIRLVTGLVPCMEAAGAFSALHLLNLDKEALLRLPASNSAAASPRRQNSAEKPEGRAPLRTPWPHPVMALHQVILLQWLLSLPDQTAVGFFFYQPYFPSNTHVLPKWKVLSILCSQQSFREVPNFILYPRSCWKLHPWGRLCRDFW